MKWQKYFKYKKSCVKTGFCSCMYNKPLIFITKLDKSANVYVLGVVTTYGRRRLYAFFDFHDEGETGVNVN